MHRRLRAVVDAGQGVVTRAGALGAADHLVLDRALRTGSLIRTCPRVYVDARRADDRRTMLAAAVRYGGARAALSHTTALEVWRLPVPAGQPIHLMVPEGVHLRGTRGVRVHRRRSFRQDPADVVVRDGIPVTRLERSIVDSWPLLDSDRQRAPVIAAVNDRLTTPARLSAVVDALPRLAGRRRLAHLLDLLARGCRSWLELWGCERVLSGGELDRLRWQVPVRLGNGLVYLDALDPHTGVNFELDGAIYHARADQRERDLRRDSALQARGYTVVRFTYARLTTEPAAVRREALAIMAGRAQARAATGGRSAVTERTAA